MAEASKINPYDSLFLGLALFAMFFGAGNLVFPPFLGLISGDAWPLAMLGFFLTGIGMPLLGLVAVSRAGGSLVNLADKVSPTFSLVLGAVIILVIGPLFAIPRTAAVTYEMGFRPVFPTLAPLWVSAGFFAVVLLFSIKPSGVLDKIGKLLTPVLLVTLGIIIIGGVLSPVGQPVETTLSNPLSRGFTEGYQTMDALGAIVFGGIIMTTLIQKGYDDPAQRMAITLRASLVAALGLALVYGGLLFLGASSSSVVDPSVERAVLTSSLAQNVLGSGGRIALGVVVSFACLTTAIGLTATVGDYFAELTGNRLGYRLLVLTTCLVSGLIATVGLETIIRAAVPILVVLYPVAIVLILLNIGEWFITAPIHLTRAVYRGAVYGALLASVTINLDAVGVSIPLLQGASSVLPLSEAGFSWVLPTLLFSLFSLLLSAGRSPSLKENRPERSV